MELIYSTEDRLRFMSTGLGCFMFLALRSSQRCFDCRVTRSGLLTRKETLAWAGGTAWHRVQEKRLAAPTQRANVVIIFNFQKRKSTEALYF